MTQPPIPETSVVLDVIRLADAYAAVRDAGYTERRAPERGELLNYLRPLSAECLAGLYAMYRLGDGRSSSPSGNLGRYRNSYSLAIQPHHRAHAAADLIAKGPLADGLRRGLSRLELGDDPGGSRGQADVIKRISSRTHR